MLSHICLAKAHQMLLFWISPEAMKASLVSVQRFVGQFLLFEPGNVQYLETYAKQVLKKMGAAS